MILLLRDQGHISSALDRSSIEAKLRKTEMRVADGVMGRTNAFYITLTSDVSNGNGMVLTHSPRERRYFLKEKLR